MTREERVRNLLTELIDMIDNGSQRDMDRADEIGTSIIKLFKQESILDEIRAEFISLYPKNYAGEPELGGLSCVFSLDKVLEIIDKYRAESEE